MTLLDTIRSTPYLLNDLIKTYDETTCKLNKYINRVKRIVIVASGTSYNAGLTVKNIYENDFEIDVELFYSNDFIHYTNFKLFEKETLFILITQGGLTKQVYNSLEKIKKYGFNHILITENINGPIAQISDCTIDMGSKNEPYIYRTVGFSTTCVVLIFIGSILSSYSKENIIIDLLKAINNLKNIDKISTDFYYKNKLKLLNLISFIFIGAANLYAIAKEVDIKFVEMLPIFANSYELEESIHGPQNSFNNNSGYFILERKNQEEEKVYSISEFISNEVTSNIWVISSKSDKNYININIQSDKFDFLEYIMFFQVFAYYISTDKNRNLTKPIYPNLTKYINKHLEDK